MPEMTVKQQARELVERLPEGASWEDIQYEIYVRQSIESGLVDSEADHVDSVSDVRRSFGLTP